MRLDWDGRLCSDTDLWQAYKRRSGSFPTTTNNRMDIKAAIEGLKALKTKCKVTIYNNNLYLVESMVKAWVQRWQQNN